MATIAGEAKAVDTNAGYPPPRQAWYTVGVLAVITTFALLDQNILGLLIQQIKTDFHLTDSQAGLLLGPTQAMFYALVGGAVFALHRPLDAQVDHGRRADHLEPGDRRHRPCRQLPAGVRRAVFVGAGELFNGPTAYSITADCFPREKLPRAVSTLQIGSVATVRFGAANARWTKTSICSGA